MGKAPAQRYGVAAPEGVVRAQVLILPGYGETAEGWFETASNLIDRGYAVWVLEGAGQGGSGRLVHPRDLGHALSVQPDVAGAAAMIKTVTPSLDHAPLIVLGQGYGAVVAFHAVEAGASVDGLILSAPDLKAGVGTAIPAWAIGPLGQLRAPGGQGWRRDEAIASGADPTRSATQQAWMLANPDLRMGGPSLSRRAAEVAASQAVLEGRRRIGASTLWIGPEDAPCRTSPDCHAQSISGATAQLHLAPDSARGPWLAAITSFTDARIAAKRDHGS